MLTQVSFKNLRALADVTLDLERFTVLVGPNGCGKSTVLNQIEWLCKASFPTEDHGHLLGWPGELLKRLEPYDHRTHEEKGAIRWYGKNSLGSSLTIQVGQDTQQRWWNQTNLALSAGDKNLTLESEAERSEPVRGDEKARRSRAFDDALREEFCWRSQRLRLSPSAVAAPSAVRVSGLDPSGLGLPTILKDLAADDTDAYLAIQEDMRVVVPHFRRTQFAKSANGNLDINHLMLDMVGGRRPADEVSDGTLLALALLTVAHHPQMPSLILMDDVDHGLHLSAQYQIIRAIRAVMERRPELQVICTTHSPILLDSFEPKEVRVMALDKEGHTRVRPLTDLPDFEKHRRGLQTGELWASSGEDWVAEADPNG